jgi:hypothetical protein
MFRWLRYFPALGHALSWFRGPGDGGPGGARTGAACREEQGAGACWPWDGPPVSKRFGGCRFAMNRQPREAPLRLGFGLEGVGGD